MADRRIAILGAGATGCCAALELASRGNIVSLFERRGVAVGEASYANEGKIHLGFVYAMDGSMRTAQRMIDGALMFESNLQRWIPYKATDNISTPFLYGVHRDSLLAIGQLLAHYKRCADYYEIRSAALKLDYLGLDSGFNFRLLGKGEFPDSINPEYIPKVVETSEHAVDPRAIAQQLREAVDANPAVIFYPEHTIESVTEKRTGGYLIEMKYEGDKRSSEFDTVVNTTWYRRLPLDRPLGIVPPAQWSHRYKLASRIVIPLAAKDLPSITCVQGPFGDLVNFGSRGFYLSWYPAGRTGMSQEESPPEWDELYTTEERQDVFWRSYRQWARRCFALDKLAFSAENVDPSGGVIYALGSTDVDNQTSRLHERHEIGIQSQRGYHSVDTGKYTLAPYWGVAIADRVEGIR